MTLHDLLATRREAVVGAWLADMLAAWPSPSSTFIAAERDPFRNPVGRVMRDALDGAFESLVSPEPLVALPSAFAELVAFCAVQPDGAVNVANRVRAMAVIAGRMLALSAPSGEHAAAMAELDERVGMLGRLASAEHARCLERLAAIRAREAAARRWVVGARSLHGHRHRPGPERPGAAAAAE